MMTGMRPSALPVFPVFLAALTVWGWVATAQSLSPAEEEQEYFLNQIFQHYGDNNRLTFEGFEHLMENLGLGGLKFDKSHNVSMHKTEGGGFVEVHDSLNLHTHNHSADSQQRVARSVTVQSLQEGCLSPEQLLVLYGLEPSHSLAISPKRFMQICPAIVHQLDRRACEASLLLAPSAIDYVTIQAWVGATVSIFVISIAGLIGVAVVPFLEKNFFHRLLGTLVALAVGTLCGDALLHLLPHAYGLQDTESAVLLSSAAFLVIMIFFIMEAIIHGKETHKKKKKKHKKENCGNYSKVHTCDSTAEDRSGVGSVAWMVISGDGLHNLTDGLAVGAAFRADLVAGLATAVAVLTHELPHELGDFAVLLKAGMSVNEAVWYNIFSSFLSFVGMAAGVMLGNIESATSWIYSATAGSFLYIALATLVPELHKYRTKGDAVPITLLQIAGMFIGGLIMFIIAMYEHNLHSLLAGKSEN